MSNTIKVLVPIFLIGLIRQIIKVITTRNNYFKLEEIFDDAINEHNQSKDLSGIAKVLLNVSRTYGKLTVISNKVGLPNGTRLSTIEALIYFKSTPNYIFEQGKSILIDSINMEFKENLNYWDEKITIETKKLFNPFEYVYNTFEFIFNSSFGRISYYFNTLSTPVNFVKSVFTLCGSFLTFILTFLNLLQLLNIDYKSYLPFFE